MSSLIFYYLFMFSSLRNEWSLTHFKFKFTSNKYNKLRLCVLNEQLNCSAKSNEITRTNNCKSTENRLHCMVLPIQVFVGFVDSFVLCSFIAIGIMWLHKKYHSKKSRYS